MPKARTNIVDRAKKRGYDEGNSSDIINGDRLFDLASKLDHGEIASQPWRRGKKKFNCLKVKQSQPLPRRFA
jgi:hypothetical protein